MVVGSSQTSAGEGRGRMRGLGRKGVIQPRRRGCCEEAGGEERRRSCRGLRCEEETDMRWDLGCDAGEHERKAVC